MAEFAIQLANVFIYNLWQALPLDMASGIGSFLVRIISRKYHRTTAATRRALHRIDPGLSAHELDHILFNMWQNIGRVWAESLIIRRLAQQRLKINGIEHIRNAMAAGRPIIVPFLHIGNWELITHVLVANGMTLNSIGEIQKRRIFDYMLNQARAANRLTVIRPDFEGTRQIYQCLQRGETLGIGIDEYKNGRVWGPRFGRNLSGSSNLDNMLRLAKKFNALLLPMYVSRHGGVNFTLHIHPPITSENTQVNNLDQLRQELEEWSEKIVREHLDQWYMLHRLRFG